MSTLKHTVKDLLNEYFESIQSDNNDADAMAKAGGDDGGEDVEPEKSK